MKNPSSRILAVAGLVAFLGFYGCNEDDKGSKAEIKAGPDTSHTARPRLVDVTSSAEKSLAMASNSAETQAAAAQSASSAPAERIKEVSNGTFDGSKEQKGLDQSSAVAVPASSEKKDVRYTAAPPKKQLDDETAAPPAPAPKDPQAAACERVLAAHDQSSDGCASHPMLSLEWAGIKDAIKDQFGSVEAVVSTLILTAVGMLLSGGWAAAAKVVKLLLVGATAWMLWKQVVALYESVKSMITAPKESDEYAEGVRQLTKSVTTVAIMAGAFKVGQKIGEAKAPKQGELSFPKQGAIQLAGKPGLAARAWQTVSGWWTRPAHA